MNHNSGIYCLCEWRGAVLTSSLMDAPKVPRLRENERRGRRTSNARLRRMTTCALLIFFVALVNAPSTTGTGRRHLVLQALRAGLLPLAEADDPQGWRPRGALGNTGGETSGIRRPSPTPQDTTTRVRVCLPCFRARRVAVASKHVRNFSHMLGRSESRCPKWNLVASSQGGHGSREEPAMTRNWHGLPFRRARNLTFAAPCDVFVGSGGRKSFKPAVVVVFGWSLLLCAGGDRGWNSGGAHSGGERFKRSSRPVPGEYRGTASKKRILTVLNHIYQVPR